MADDTSRGINNCRLVNRLLIRSIVGLWGGIKAFNRIRDVEAYFAGCKVDSCFRIINLL